MSVTEYEGDREGGSEFGRKGEKVKTREREC